MPTVSDRVPTLHARFHSKEWDRDFGSRYHCNEGVKYGKDTKDGEEAQEARINE